MYKSEAKIEEDIPVNNRWRGFTVNDENIPRPRAGVYLIRHLPTGKCYVGAAKNVEKRCKEHSVGRGNVPEFSAFLRPYLGRGNSSRRHLFEITPLWYASDPAATKKTAGTHFVEQAMICAYDTIGNGWNQPHPDVASLSKLPEAIQKRKATEESEDTQANRSNGAVKRWSTRAVTYTHNGETKSLMEWARCTGVPYETLYWRYQRGRDIFQSAI